MRYSKALLPTLKEVPADATMASHQLLLRGGFIRRVAAGIYEYLPLGWRVLRRVVEVVREEMDRAGAMEILMPVVLPAELWKETGRWETFGPQLLRAKDRKGNDYCIGPTHEEVVTDLARREIRSYRELPRNLYQIQTKFRDEPRPRAGLIRCREFVMKDAYSFDADDDKARLSYRAMVVAYARILARLGFDFRVVEADSGAMGGSSSHEFQVLCNAGEDAIVACGSCDYAANVEAAHGQRVDAEPAGSRTSIPAPVVVDTPGQHTIAEVSAFLKVRPAELIKTLIYVWEDRAVAVLVRGDDDVNEVKLARAVGAQEVFLAADAEVQRVTGAPVGFAGPIGLKLRLLADRHVADVRDGVAGANQADKHVVHVLPERDFKAEYLDLRTVRSGDACPHCGNPLRRFNGIEAGHTFVLGTHYSAKMKATYLGEDGQSRPLVMGCYGIGVSRLVASAIEQHHDDHGMLWPVPIAPYSVALLALGNDPAVGVRADEAYHALQSAGIEALYDDREERPGVKFMDADLLGLPFRVVIGKKGNAEGWAEVRRRGETQDQRVPFEQLETHLRRQIAAAQASCNAAADEAERAVLKRLGFT
jgi:prolyl-tRNA synthetase